MPAPTFLSLLKADASREQLEEWCRGKTQSYSIEGSVVCRVLGKYIMSAASGDTALTPHLALDGIWEPWITMAIARHLKPGMRCMDVGACYGYYALLMADIVGIGGMVEAWDPIWGDALLANINLNGFDVTVHRAFMGTSDHWFDFKRPTGSFNAGNVKTYPAENHLFSGYTRVGTRAPEPATYEFIKIDVEGNEADVWQALAGVRAASPSLTVCMEFTPSKHDDPKLFLEYLSIAYELGTVGHDGVPRRCSAEEALVPDTGDFRMLWLTKKAGA
jgi:FkbM family methyltransferase